MASLLKSEAAFDLKAKDCGLPDDEVAKLKAAGITNISLLAFAATAPGTAPTEDQLRNLLRPGAPDSLGVGTLAALRHLMFECQTLCLVHVKASVEGTDRKVELVPAERNSRIAAQKARMKGLTLSGPLECSHGSYDYVGQMLEKDSPMYLEPHRFDTRAAEVAREKPGKELVLDQNKISVRDRSDKGRCAIQDTLSLHQALQRRALACDLMSACSYEALHEWHSFMLERLQQSPPPNCARLTVEQILRADRAAWVRLSEKVHTLKPNASGALPLDAAIADLNRDPTVLFHLLNVREVRPVEPPRVPPKKEDKFAKLDNKRRHEELKKNNQDPNKSQKAELPDELKAIPGLKLATAEGEKFCWPYNCAKGCRFAKAGKACRRGKHACMKCGKNHSLQECKE